MPVDANHIHDVLIIGYGPIGATFANLLAQDGHSVAVAEMHPGIFEQPRAINLDQEALRLLQRIGLATTISEGCAPHPGTDFLGADGKLIKAIYSAPPPYPLGWPANLMFIQPDAEQHLRTRVESLEQVDVFLEHTAIAIEQFEDFVRVDLESTAVPSSTSSSSKGPKSIRARYVIGCDGANSLTRAQLGVRQTDMGFSEHYVVVDAWLTQDTELPLRTTQYCLPSAPTSYVVCSQNLRRWELKILPDEDPDDFQDLERIKARLAPFVDVDALKFWRSSVYHFNARIADEWRRHRVFLAGDAAHTMPPFLGQGLNSGLRDVANLSWKLSYVLQGKASESLLDSYQVERHPHISQLTEITKELGLVVGETDPKKAAVRDIRLRAEMASEGQVTVRQNLIPPLKAGFLDSAEGPLAGTLSPQPRVIKDGRSYLLDDLLAGFSRVSLSSDKLTLDVMINLESDNPTGFTCEDTEGLMTAHLNNNAVSGIAIRPDGVVWSAITNNLDTGHLQKQLQQSLHS